MSTLKRNEPCYCGSGLKYKHCHLKQDQAASKERRHFQVAAEFLRRDFLKYARDDRFAQPLAKALPRYWNGYYDIENAEEMSQPEALRFFDWFMFDCEWEDEQGQQVRLGDLYRQEKWDELSTHQQQLLDAWLDVLPAAAYRLVSYQGQNLQLRELVSGQEVTVYEGAGRGDAAPGDVILARPVPVGERMEFSVHAALLPEDEVGQLPQKLQEARQAAPDSELAVFLRNHSYLPIHHALKEAERKGRPPVARLDPDREDGKRVAAARKLRRLQRR